MSANKAIPVSIPIMRPYLPPLHQYAEAVEEIFSTASLSNFGKYSRLLEDRASRVLEHPGTLCVSSCDIGLVLAWRALGCTCGEVITPSFTFCSTVNALTWNGLTPVFADIDPETLCLDIGEVRKLITPRTVGITAVHVFGRPAAITELEALAQEYGLKLVFDAAHALGAKYRGRALGSLGDASIFSLSGTKLVTGGEGGLATFRSSEVAERFRALRGYGFLGDYNCQDIGLNGKLSELNAALAYLSLGMLEEAVERRQAIGLYYRRRLGDVPQCSFQMSAEWGDRHAYKDFAVLFARSDQRCRAEQALNQIGVQTKRYFMPVHKMTAYAKLACAHLPVTEDIYERILCLPIYHTIQPKQIDRICETLIAAIRSEDQIDGLAHAA